MDVATWLQPTTVGGMCQEATTYDNMSYNTYILQSMYNTTSSSFLSGDEVR